MNRNSCTALLALMLCASLSHAQSEPTEHHPKSTAYLRVGVGYGLPHAGRTELNGVGISGREGINGNNYTMEVERASFGAGFAASLAGGYMITRHIGVELGVHAVLAPTKYSFTGLVFGFNNRPYTSETYAKMPVYAIPAVVLTTGERVKVYSRVGLVLPLSDKLINKETRAAAGMGQTEQVFTRELEHRFSIGLQGAAGLSYGLSEHLSAWVEATVISRNAYAKRSELTAYTEDGIDGLSAFTTNQKVTEYEFSYEAPFQPAASEPDKQPSFSVPFGSIGMSLGVKYNF